MEEWICPIDSIDEDIREVVKTLHENGMKPYMSCSGTYKDHKSKSMISTSADIEMLDSDAARELLAMLISDNRFKCSIAKENERYFYDNKLPYGLRIQIEFENICGDNQEEVLSAINEILTGKKACLTDRKKIDMVCDLLESVMVQGDNRIKFSFNDEQVKQEDMMAKNYSISVTSEKDFETVYIEYKDVLSGFTQSSYSSKFYGEDYITQVAFLKKLIEDYDKIPKSKQPKTVVEDKTRINKFMHLYSEKETIAMTQSEEIESAKGMELQEIDITDLSGFFGGDDGAI